MKPGAEIFPLWNQCVEKFSGSCTVVGGGCENFEAVFINADIEKDVLMAEFFPEISGVCICLEKLEGMADMGNCVGIGEGGGNVERFVESELLV